MLGGNGWCPIEVLGPHPFLYSYVWKFGTPKKKVIGCQIMIKSFENILRGTYFAKGPLVS